MRDRMYYLLLQVHARHFSCWGGAACICGVAMREESLILAVDMCNDSVVHYITYSANNLPNGAGIYTTGGGYFIRVGQHTWEKKYVHMLPFSVEK